MASRKFIVSIGAAITLLSCGSEDHAAGIRASGGSSSLGGAHFGGSGGGMKGDSGGAHAGTAAGAGGDSAGAAGTSDAGRATQGGSEAAGGTSGGGSDTGSTASDAGAGGQVQCSGVSEECVIGESACCSDATCYASTDGTFCVRRCRHSNECDSSDPGCCAPLGENGASICAPMQFCL